MPLLMTQVLLSRRDRLLRRQARPSYLLASWPALGSEPNDLIGHQPETPAYARTARRSAATQADRTTTFLWQRLPNFR